MYVMLITPAEVLHIACVMSI